MAAALSEERDVIEEVIEPYLIQQGFVQRTPRGRMLTETAFRHLELPVPASLPGQFDLLAGLSPEENLLNAVFGADLKEEAPDEKSKRVDPDSK
jgi:Holliday junction DNA helicase RuvB